MKGPRSEWSPLSIVVGVAFAIVLPVSFISMLLALIIMFATIVAVMVWLAPVFKGAYSEYMELADAYAATLAERFFPNVR